MVIQVVLFFFLVFGFIWMINWFIIISIVQKHQSYKEFKELTYTGPFGMINKLYNIAKEEPDTKLKRKYYHHFWYAILFIPFMFIGIFSIIFLLG